MSPLGYPAVIDVSISRRLTRYKVKSWLDYNICMLEIYGFLYALHEVPNKGMHAKRKINLTTSTIGFCGHNVLGGVVFMSPSLTYNIFVVYLTTTIKLAININVHARCSINTLSKIRTYHIQAQIGWMWMPQYGLRYHRWFFGIFG